LRPFITGIVAQVLEQRQKTTTESPFIEHQRHFQQGHDS